MKNHFLILIIFFFTIPWLNAQEQEITKPQVLVNLGWGAIESEYDFKESMLLAAEIQTTYKSNFFSARGLFVRDNDYLERKLQSYSLLYGYIENFDKHSIYLASGVSWNQFNETDELDGEQMETRDYKTFGVPLNAGFNVMLSKHMGLNAQAFYNFNQEDNFIGYYVAFRVRVW